MSKLMFVTKAVVHDCHRSNCSCGVFVLGLLVGVVMYIDLSCGAFRGACVHGRCMKKCETNVEVRRPR